MKHSKKPITLNILEVMQRDIQFQFEIKKNERTNEQRWTYSCDMAVP